MSLGVVFAPQYAVGGAGNVWYLMNYRCKFFLKARKKCHYFTQAEFLRGNTNSLRNSVPNRQYSGGGAQPGGRFEEQVGVAGGEFFGIGQHLAELARAGQAGHQTEHVAGDTVEL